MNTRQSVIRNRKQHSPESAAWAYRFWFGFACVLSSLLAAAFIAIPVAGILAGDRSLILQGLLLCVSFAAFWRGCGSLVCRDLRRRRDRALKRLNRG